jgi:hypothetical protein
MVGSELPSPYVKTYLLPDPDKQTKRKTKVVKDSTHPTYNEVVRIKFQLFENFIVLIFKRYHAKYLKWTFPSFNLDTIIDDFRENPVVCTE